MMMLRRWNIRNRIIDLRKKIHLTQTHVTWMLQTFRCVHEAIRAIDLVDSVPSIKAFTCLIRLLFSNGKGLKVYKYRLPSIIMKFVYPLVKFVPLYSALPKLYCVVVETKTCPLSSTVYRHSTRQRWNLVGNFFSSISCIRRTKVLLSKLFQYWVGMQAALLSNSATRWWFSTDLFRYIRLGLCFSAF